MDLQKHTTAGNVLSDEPRMLAEITTYFYLPLPVLFCCQWQQRLHQMRCKYKEKTCEHYCTTGLKRCTAGTRGGTRLRREAKASDSPAPHAARESHPPRCLAQRSTRRRHCNSACNSSDHARDTHNQQKAREQTVHQLLGFLASFSSFSH